MNGQRQEEVLFLALTRPPIMPFLGLPHGVALLFLLTAGEIIIWTKGFFGLIFLIPLWAVATLYVRHDYNAMHILGLFLQTQLRSIDIWRWGGGSLSPYPLKSKLPRGVVL